MNELVRWQTEHVPSSWRPTTGKPGFQSVPRTGDIIHDAADRFEDAFAGMRSAANSARRSPSPRPAC